MLRKGHIDAVLGQIMDNVESSAAGSGSMAEVILSNSGTLGDPAMARTLAALIDATAGNDVAVDYNLGPVNHLHRIDSAQQGGCAGTKGTNQSDALVTPSRQVEALQHLIIAIDHPQSIGFNEGHGFPALAHSKVALQQPVNQVRLQAGDDDSCGPRGLG